MPDNLEYSCGICGTQTKTERGLKIHTTRVHGEPLAQAEWGEDRDYSDEPGVSGPVAPQTDERSPYTPEVAPEPPKQTGWKERIWGGDAPPGAKRQAPANRPRKRRASTEGIWVTAWTGIGLGLVRSGADIPVGNCMQFQAPIVGDVLDEAIAGTFIDTLLQPIAGTGKRFKKVSSVISLPILVGVMERSPAVVPVLEPMLRQVIRENLVEMAKVVKAQEKANAEYTRALVDLGLEVGDDPIDGVIAAIFPTMGEPAMNGSGKVGSDASP